MSERDPVTVSCGASVDEMREARKWLFSHDRASRSVLGFVLRFFLAALVAQQAFARSQREGPTTLTVSATGLEWKTNAGHSFVVPRSTVGAIDFQRIVSLAQAYSKPVSSFDSRSLQPAR